MELQEEGFRFHPTDSELLTFLLRFLAEQPLRDDGYISHLDVYDHEPWVTYDYGHHCGGEEDGDTSICRYFITPRHKKKEENGRFKREVWGILGKLGTWKQQDKGKKVMTMNNRNNAVIMGYRKSLSYEPTEKSDSPDDGKWLMKEYTFCETIMKRFTNSEFRNYIICTIKKKCKKGSSEGSRRSNVLTIRDSSDEEKVDTKMISGVNSFDQSRMDQEYNTVECQGASSSSGVKNDHVTRLTTTSQIQEFRTNAILENNYGMITPPINPVMELDHLEVQIQEAASARNDVLEFENPMPEINLPEEPAHDLQEGCTFGVNENHIAYSELQAIHTTSFVELLTGGGDSATRNNQVQIQEAPGGESGQLGPNTYSQIQEPVLNLCEIYDNLAEHMGLRVLTNLDDELMNSFNSFEQSTIESTQPQVQTQENGPLGLTAPFSQIQELVMPENSVPEMFDTGDTLFEKNQTEHQPTPQEESETLWETEEKSSMVVNLAEELLDHTPIKDRLDAIRASNSTVMLDQQSWQSNAHLEDMLPWTVSANFADNTN